MPTLDEIRIKIVTAPAGVVQLSGEEIKTLYAHARFTENVRPFGHLFGRDWRLNDGESMFTIREADATDPR